VDRGEGLAVCNFVRGLDRLNFRRRCPSSALRQESVPQRPVVNCSTAIGGATWNYGSNRLAFMLSVKHAHKMPGLSVRRADIARGRAKARDSSCGNSCFIA